MNIVLMKCKGLRDCAVAAIGTACQVSYDAAARALNHMDLPGPLESPLLSNPWNLYRALIRLGYWKKNITWGMLRDGKAMPGKTIVLVKNSQLEQHWVVWDGLQHFSGGKTFHRIYWGDSVEPVFFTPERMKEMFLSHWPNCAFQVYRASFWRLIWARAQSWFRPS